MPHMIPVNYDLGSATHNPLYTCDDVSWALPAEALVLRLATTACEAVLALDPNFQTLSSENWFRAFAPWTKFDRICSSWCGLNTFTWLNLLPEYTNSIIWLWRYATYQHTRQQSWISAWPALYFSFFCCPFLMFPVHFAFNFYYIQSRGSAGRQKYRKPTFYHLQQLLKAAFKRKVLEFSPVKPLHYTLCTILRSSYFFKLFFFLFLCCILEVGHQNWTSKYLRQTVQ